MGRKKRKGKAKPGTWLTRDLLKSRAFWALTATAKGMLHMFLLKRDMDHNHNCINRQNITLTYLELENLFDEKIEGEPNGLSRASISRGTKDLLAKGFIEIVKQGGAYQKDKTIYGLTDDWKRWRPGEVIRKKQKGKKAARLTHEENLNPHKRTHTHPHNRTQNDYLWVSK